MLGARRTAGSQEYPPVPGKPNHAKPVPIGFLRPGTGCARGKKKKNVSKHKPQALLAGPQAVFPACMPRLVTRKEHAAWRRAGAHKLAELAPRFVLARTPDLLDMSRMVLRTEGPQHLPRGYEIMLYVPVSDADKVGVFHVQSKSFPIAASSTPSPSS